MKLKKYLFEDILNPKQLGCDDAIHFEARRKNDGRQCTIHHPCSYDKQKYNERVCSSFSHLFHKKMCNNQSLLRYRHTLLPWVCNRLHLNVPTA